MSETKVVTRYGGFMHIATYTYPFQLRGRLFTQCRGTSAWTLASWEANPDHPLLAIDEIRALPDCPSCAEVTE